MSITLVTGLPGSGKTLFCIDKLLHPLIGAIEKKVDHDGVVTLVHRKIYSNINRLTLDHELIEPGPAWGQHQKSRDWVQADGNVQGLHNWHEWAQPGSMVIWDEIQKPWPNRANGSAVPPDLAALETHRHMGVDFIVLTQKPRLADPHLLELADRHLHMRRMSTLPMALVYEWDGVSKGLTYKASLSRKPYWYSRKTFKLYHSADLHTKQRRTLPTVLWAVVIGVAGAAYFGPQTYANITAKKGKSVIAAVTPASGPAKAASGPAKPPGGPLPLVPAVPLPLPTVVPSVVAGCARIRDTCRCFDKQGGRVDKTPEFCEAKFEVVAGAAADGVARGLERLSADPRVPAVHVQEDDEVLAFLRARRDRRPE